MNTIVRASPLGPRYTVIFGESWRATHFQWVPARPSKILGIELYYDLEHGQTVERIAVGPFEQLASKCPAYLFRCSTPELVGTSERACYMTFDLATVGPSKPFTIVFSEPIAPLAIHYMEKP